MTHRWFSYKQFCLELSTKEVVPVKTTWCVDCLEEQVHCGKTSQTATFQHCEQHKWNLQLYLSEGRNLRSAHLKTKTISKAWHRWMEEKAFLCSLVEENKALHFKKPAHQYGCKLSKDDVIDIENILQACVCDRRRKICSSHNPDRAAMFSTERCWHH